MATEGHFEASEGAAGRPSVARPRLINTYYVFLASPGDVNAERDVVRDFFHDFNITDAGNIGLRFEVVDWENYATVGVGRPQDLITRQTLGRFGDSLALVVGIMAQRFGSPTGSHDSGTEEEFECALEARGQRGYPEIKWFFRKVKHLDLPAQEPELTRAVNQWKKVKKFRERIEKERLALCSTFTDTTDFKDRFVRDLRMWLNDTARPWKGSAPPASPDHLADQALSPRAAEQPVRRISQMPWASRATVAFVASFAVVALWKGVTKILPKYDPVAAEAASVVGGLPTLVRADTAGKVVGWWVNQRDRVTPLIARYWGGDGHYAKLAPEDQTLGPGPFGGPNGNYYIIHNYGTRGANGLRLRITTRCSLALAEELGNAKLRDGESKVDPLRSGFGASYKYVIGHQVYSVPGTAPKADGSFVVQIHSLPPGSEIVIAEGGPCSSGGQRISANGWVQDVPKPERLDFIVGESEKAGYAALDFMGELEKVARDEQVVSDLVAYLGRTRSWLVKTSIMITLLGRRDQEFGNALCSLAGAAQGDEDDRWVRLIATYPLGHWYHSWTDCLKRAAEKEPRVLEILVPRAGVDDRRDAATLSAFLDLLTSRSGDRGLLCDIGARAFGDAAWCQKFFHSVAAEISRPGNSLESGWATGLTDLLANGVSCAGLAESDRKTVLQALCRLCGTGLFSQDRQGASPGCQAPFERLRPSLAGKLEDYLWSCSQSGVNEVANPGGAERQRRQILQALPNDLKDERWVGAGQELLASGFEKGSTEDLGLAVELAARLSKPGVRELLQHGWRDEWLEQPVLLPKYLVQATRAGLTLPKVKILGFLPRIPATVRSDWFKLARGNEFAPIEFYQLWRSGDQTAYSLLRDRLRSKPEQNARIVTEIAKDLKTLPADAQHKDFLAAASRLLKELSEAKWCQMQRTDFDSRDVSARTNALKNASPCLLDITLAAANDTAASVREESVHAMAGLLARDGRNQYNPSVQAVMARIVGALRRLALDKDGKVSSAAHGALCSAAVPLDEYVKYLTELSSDKGKRAPAFKCISSFSYYWRGADQNFTLRPAWKNVVPGILRTTLTGTDRTLCTDAARFVADHCVREMKAPIAALAAGSDECAESARRAGDILEICEQR